MTIFVLCLVQAIVLPAWHTREHVRTASKLGIRGHVSAAHAAGNRTLPWFLRYAPFFGTQHIDASIVPKDRETKRTRVYLDGVRSAVALYCLAGYISFDRLLHIAYGNSPFFDLFVAVAMFIVAAVIGRYKAEVCIYLLVPFGVVAYVATIWAVGYGLRHPRFAWGILVNHPFPLLFGMALCYGIAMAGLIPWPWAYRTSRGEEVWRSVLGPNNGWAIDIARGITIPVLIGGSILWAVFSG